ncbi:hypothetical protein FHS78_003597 [Parvibaculum indicum]|uniref:hypothetical protein n=1 Tax=Parvibaculum indicum TaxID=562969 RepID=UPI00142358A6|nr:hypothetical protein [Parvibaculum indicum]NIJ43284.1 hypothetical protein [Parvibaculum indicum]
MNKHLRDWLWLPLWAISVGLILFVRTDSVWLRALMIAPLFAAVMLQLMAKFRSLFSDA